MIIIISLILAIAPALLLVYYYYRQDRKKPEPKGLIIRIFLIGILSTFPILILELILSSLKGLFGGHPLLLAFFEGFIIAACCEEYIKYLVVKRYVYHDIHFDEEVDGIVYAVVASLGFACLENVIFVLDTNLATALVRAVTSVPLHALASGMMGYYIGCAKFAVTPEEERSLLTKGVLVAIVIHGVYDFILLAQPIFGRTSSLAIVILLFFVFLGLKEKIKYALATDTMMHRS